MKPTEDDACICLPPEKNCSIGPETLKLLLSWSWPRVTVVSCLRWAKGHAQRSSVLVMGLASPTPLEELASETPGI